MDARLVDQVIGSPAITRLILLACITGLFLYPRRKFTDGHSSAFLALLGILAVRDFLSAYHPSPELFFISDVLAMIFSIFIFIAPYNGSRVVLVLAIGFNVIVATLFLVSVAYDLSFGIPAPAFGYLLVADAVFAGFVSFVNRKDRSNPARHLVSRIWPLAVLILLSYAVLAMAMGYEDLLFLGLVMPLSYGWILAAALLSLGIHEREMSSALGFYEAAIDSLYSIFLIAGSAQEDGCSGPEALNRLNDTLISGTGAEGGIILLPDGSGSLAVRAYAGLFPPLPPLSSALPQTAGDVELCMRQSRFGLDHGLFAEVGRAGKNIFCPVAEHDARFAVNSKDDILRISSFMAVPLMVKDRILGVAALVRTSEGSVFKEADYNRFKLLADFGSCVVSALIAGNCMAGKETRNPGTVLPSSEMVLREIEKSILSSWPPRCPGLSVDAFSLTDRGSAGAYFDLIQSDKGRVIAVVAEPSSQGLRAALVLLMLRSVLLVLGRTDMGMEALLKSINRILKGSIEADLSLSVGLVCLNLRTKELEFANAGNLGVLVCRQGARAFDSISTLGLPIGKEEHADYERIRLQVHSGDVVVMYTEGITERLDNQGNPFGRQALARTILGHGDSDAKEVLEGIRGALAAFGGSNQQQTGQTVLVMKVE